MNRYHSRFYLPKLLAVLFIFGLYVALFLFPEKQEESSHTELRNTSRNTTEALKKPAPQRRTKAVAISRPLLEESGLKEGDTLKLKSMEGREFLLEVTMRRESDQASQQAFGLRRMDAESGLASLFQDATGTLATVMAPDEGLVYRWHQANGMETLEEVPMTEMLPCWKPRPAIPSAGGNNKLSAAGCDDPQFPTSANLPVTEGSEVEAWSNPLGAIPAFDSRPLARAVIYMDFNGEANMNQPNWYYQTFSVGHSGMSTDEMTMACEVVSEDFRPWNVSVTTNLARYEQAGKGWRMRVIITPTSNWMYSTFNSIPASGVAWRCTFGRAGTLGWTEDVPCFIFRETTAHGKHWGFVSSHEVGHTMGLSHDGGGHVGMDEYYSGHGLGFFSSNADTGPWNLANHWAPIMGDSKSSCVTHWCNWSGSPYLGLQNFEDDVAIIGSAENHFGPVLDDHTNSLTSATNLIVSGANVSGSGEIGVEGDTDAFRFTVPSTARVRIDVKTLQLIPDADPWQRMLKNLGIPNLNIRAKFYNASQTQIANVSETDNFRYRDDTFPMDQRLRPADALNAYHDTTLAAGTYYVVVSGDGFTGTQDIYPSYGSMGRYAISGSIDPQPVLANNPPANGTVGIFYQYQIQAQNSVTDYNATGLPSGLVVNRTSGLISGVPTSAGTSNAVIIATGPGGTVQMNLTFAMVGSSVVGDAVDATSLAWTTPSGLFGWFRQTAVTNDGQDAAQSADINDNEQAAMETTVTGPGLLTFYWKVSSEYRWDFLRFEIDGVERDRIHQEVNWEQKSYTLTSGPHTLRWVYQKDGTVSASSDAGWVDQVVWNAGTAPQFIGPGNVEAYVGTPLAIQPQFTNNPTSYGYSALPQGLSMNIQTGLITGTPEQAVITTTNIGAYSPQGVGQGTIRWTILAPPGLPVFQGPYRMFAELGRPFYARLRATNGGSNWQAYAYSFYSGNIPAGLTLNSVTGEITGTPTGFSDLVGWRCTNSVGPALGSCDFYLIDAGQYTYANYASYHRLGNGPTLSDNLTLFQHNDHDRDGQSNFREFLARTDPNDPNSAFRMLSTIGPGTAANTVRLTWESMPAVAYYADTSTNGLAWTALTPVDSMGGSIPSPVNGSPASPLTAQDFSFPFAQPGHSRAFFRIRIQP